MIGVYGIEELAYGFGFGFLSAGAFALIGFMAAQEKAKTAFDYKKFLGTALIGGVAGICIINLNLEFSQIGEILGIMGAGAVTQKALAVVKATYAATGQKAIKSK